MAAMSRKGWKIGAGAVLAALFVLVAYEAYAIRAAHGRTPTVLARAAQGELSYDDLSARRRAMLLAIEDPKFFEHKGLDFRTPGAGATTLTQALVKRFYFDPFRPGFAKIEQSLIARFVLDPALSKQGQLVAVLNHVSFGHQSGRHVVGFADASRTYFGREFRTLDDRQFLGLVAMLIAPNALDPIRHPEANAERVRRIERMLAGRCRPTSNSDVTYEACAGA